MKKIYYKLGLLTGAVGLGVGSLRYIQDTLQGNTPGITGIIINLFYCFTGIVLIIATAGSKNRISLRYYSKLLQIILFYLIGSIELLYSGEVSTIISYLLGITLAYRYSLLKARTLVLTAIINSSLIIISAVLRGVGVIYFIDEVLFVLFVYSVIYFIYTDFTKILDKRFSRLNRELDLARRITPFGRELKKRLASTDTPSLDFTRKEYEVMVAICFYEKLTNEELSDFMNISVATVKSHLNNIYKKTGIHNRSRLIAVYKNIFIPNSE